MNPSLKTSTFKSLLRVINTAIKNNKEIKSEDTSYDKIVRKSTQANRTFHVSVQRYITEYKFILF